MGLTLLDYYQVLCVYYTSDIDVSHDLSFELLKQGLLDLP